MRIADYTLGKVVYQRCIDTGSPYYNKPYCCTTVDWYTTSKKSYQLTGHIIGFTLNSEGETIVNVKWNDGTEHVVHPYNLIDAVEWADSISDKFVKT